MRVITRGLIKLGLLKGKERDLIKAEAYRDFYMHRAGHWLGLDVHDVGDYRIDGRWRQLEPGMVLTIEPGIYIAADTQGCQRWRGIGIRIEDDVAVTETGCDVLTADVPKRADDIEALMSEASRATGSRSDSRGSGGPLFAIALATEAPSLDITLLEAHPFRSGTPTRWIPGARRTCTPFRF